MGTKDFFFLYNLELISKEMQIVYGWSKPVWVECSRANSPGWWGKQEVWPMSGVTWWETHEESCWNPDLLQPSPKWERGETGHVSTQCIISVSPQPTPASVSVPVAASGAVEELCMMEMEGPHLYYFFYEDTQNWMLVCCRLRRNKKWNRFELYSLIKYCIYRKHDINALKSG